MSFFVPDSHLGYFIPFIGHVSLTSFGLCHFSVFWYLVFGKKSLNPAQIDRGEGGGRINLYFLEWEVSMYITSNSSVRKICLFSLVYLFNHLCLCRLMHIYFIYWCIFWLLYIYFALWVIIQCNIIIFIFSLKFQLWPLRALPVGSCVPLAWPHSLIFWAFHYFLVLQDASGSSYIFPSLVL